MTLPLLKDWTPTATGLHRAAQILAGVRMLLLPHQPNYLELALDVIPEGLTTGRLPGDGEIWLDMRRAALVYRHPERGETVVPLAGTTQAYANRALLIALRDGELAGTLADTADDDLLERFTAAVRARYPDLPAHHTAFSETDPLRVDPQVSRAYAAVQDAVFTGIARFRARVQGHWFPAVVYPEHFDLSTIWFYAPDFDENGAHITIGFAPFSDGLPRPYLYLTAYPYPDNLTEPPLPKPAVWNVQPWRGVVIAYDSVASFNDATEPDGDAEALAARIETLCAAVFKMLRGMVAANSSV
ncbi:MAG: DUF5996 family protein [bacterium]|nr:DUF5996 family protein [bacterium]